MGEALKRHYLSIVTFFILISLLALLTGCKKTETVTEKETISYKSIKENDSSMWKGEEKVAQEGIDGEKELTYKLTYQSEDDTSPEKELVKEKIIKKPKDEILKVGTKPRGTGKVIAVKGAKVTITIVERTAFSAGGSDGDYLAIYFHVDNSEGNQFVSFINMFFGIKLKDGKTLVDGANYSLTAGGSNFTSSYKIGETGKFYAYYNLNPDSIKENPSIKGPEDVTLLVGENLSTKLFAGLSGVKEYKLTDFWIGPLSIYQN